MYLAVFVQLDSKAPPPAKELVESDLKQNVYVHSHLKQEQLLYRYVTVFSQMCCAHVCSTTSILFFCFRQVNLETLVQRNRERSQKALPFISLAVHIKIYSIILPVLLAKVSH